MTHNETPLSEIEILGLKFFLRNLPSGCQELDHYISAKGTSCSKTRRFVSPQTGQDHSLARERWVKDNGPIPEGKRIVNICGNKKCSNPKHLLPFTMSQVNAFNKCTSREDFLASTFSIDPSGNPVAVAEIKIPEGARLVDLFGSQIVLRDVDGCTHYGGHIREGRFSPDEAKVSRNGNMIRPRRALYIQATGHNPGSRLTRTCKDPLCVNPGHQVAAANHRVRRGRGLPDAAIAEEISKHAKTLYPIPDHETARLVAKVFGEQQICGLPGELRAAESLAGVAAGEIETPKEGSPMMVARQALVVRARENNCIECLGQFRKRGFTTDLSIVYAPDSSRCDVSAAVTFPRWFYQYVRGFIPADVVLVRTCETPSCINPYHMVPMTISQRSRYARCQDRKAFIAEHFGVDPYGTPVKGGEKVALISPESGAGSPSISTEENREPDTLDPFRLRIMKTQPLGEGSALLTASDNTEPIIVILGHGDSFTATLNGIISVTGATRYEALDNLERKVAAIRELQL